MNTIKILDEHVVLFGEGKKMLPSAPSRATLDRAALEGTLVGEKTVTLEWCYVQNGRLRATSMEAWLRYHKAINQDWKLRRPKYLRQRARKRKAAKHKKR